MGSLSAEDLKQQGNKLFQLNRFDEAISHYTKAIVKNPEVPQYFTNRALCYLNLKQPEKCIEDCRKALELDKRLVKAYFFLGRGLNALDQFDEAVKCLIRANELAKAQRLTFGDEITQALRYARRGKFLQEEEKRIGQEIELQSYLTRLINEDREQQLKRLKSADEPPTKEETEQIEQSCNLRIRELNDLITQVDDRRRKREVPDFLCGKISFELMKDPVITPSGITYDRKDIVEHLSRVGRFDPITRAPLSVEQLIPNLAMKEVIDYFLEQNEWAYDM